MCGFHGYKVHITMHLMCTVTMHMNIPIRCAHAKSYDFAYHHASHVYSHDEHARVQFLACSQDINECTTGKVLKIGQGGQCRVELRGAWTNRHEVKLVLSPHIASWARLYMSIVYATQQSSIVVSLLLVAYAMRCIPLGV